MSSPGRQVRDDDVREMLDTLRLARRLPRSQLNFLSGVLGGFAEIRPSTIRDLARVTHLTEGFIGAFARLSRASPHLDWSTRPPASSGPASSGPASPGPARRGALSGDPYYVAALGLLALSLESMADASAPRAPRCAAPRVDVGRRPGAGQTAGIVKSPPQRRRGA